MGQDACRLGGARNIPLDTDPTYMYSILRTICVETGPTIWQEPGPAESVSAPTLRCSSMRALRAISGDSKEMSFYGFMQLIDLLRDGGLNKSN